MHDATPEDCAQLAPNLRQADRDEVLAASGKAPLAALLHGYMESSECYAVRCGGQAIAIFGVVNLGGGEGAPWLLGSDAILSHWREFVRHSRQELERIRQPYRRLWNFVDARNTLHRRWLAWLGAEETELEPHYGVARLPFWRFDFV